MIGYIQGRMIDCSDGKWLVGVGHDSNVIGYSITVPQKPSYEAFSLQSTVVLYVYTHVREDLLDLYGFLTPGEKELFLTLLTVNGIGPKGALSILSRSDPNQLVQTILTGDKEALLGIPGIGKKTAERIVLELKEPLKKKTETNKWKEYSQTSSQIAPGSPGQNLAQRMFLRDAKEALVSLGYREQEVLSTLNRLLSSENPPQKIEDLIRSALKTMGEINMNN